MRYIKTVTVLLLLRSISVCEQNEGLVKLIERGAQLEKLAEGF